MLLLLPLPPILGVKTDERALPPVTAEDLKELDRTMVLGRMMLKQIMPYARTHTGKGVC